MPEQTLPRFHRWTLADAHDAGYLVRLRCQWCGGERLYRPGDLRRLSGNVDLDRLLRGKRCERCGRRDYLDATYWYPSAAELEGRSIRRLVSIRTIRRPVWRDEPA